MRKLTISLFLIVLIFLPAFSFAFPLPDGNYVPAKMPMYQVFPRPDNETQSHARHRWAHPDFRYEIPIGVQGGAWPFKYEIIAGPAGATIGQLHGDTNYGVVTWTPATDSGTVLFTIRVTDQEMNTIDISWSTTIDATQFVFIQDGWTGTKAGTISEPLESFADWYKGDRADSTYHNKIIVFRDGNYTAYGASATNGNVRLDADSKTPSLIGYPDETPAIDCAQAKIFSDVSPLRDIFIYGLRFNNARTDVANSHFLWMIGDTDRLVIANNYFYNLGNGTAGTDNPSGIFISGTSQDKHHILVKNNTFDTFTNNGPNGSFFDMYRTYYVLVEENTMKNSDNQYGIWAKVSKAFVTIRANDMYENMTSGGIAVHYGDAAPGTPHDHEVCWNRVVFNNTGNALTLLFMGDSLTAENENHYNSFIYRNTFKNGSAWVRFAGAEPYEVDGNVVESNNLARWATSTMTTNIQNLTGSASAGITDSEGTLIGDYRLNYLGRNGHEISSSYSTVPNPPVNPVVQ